MTGLDRLDEAKEALDEALAEAESQDARRALCQVLPALAALSERRGDPDQAKELRAGPGTRWSISQTGPALRRCGPC